MSKRNRQRGFEYEREIVNMAKEMGFQAERTWGSNGESRGLNKNVDVIINDKYHIQCKRQKGVVSDRYVPDENIFAQCVRGDRQESFTVMRTDRFLHLLHVLWLSEQGITINDYKPTNNAIKNDQQNTQGKD